MTNAPPLSAYSTNIKVLITVITLLWSGVVGLIGYAFGANVEHTHSSMTTSLTRLDVQQKESIRRLDRIEWLLDRANARLDQQERANP